MVFADLIFLYLFMPATVLIYFASKNQTLRNVSLVLLSLFFYAWGEPVWIIALIFSGSFDYLHGIFMERTEGKKIRILGVISSVVINMALLMTFKYSGFFTETLNSLLGTAFRVPSFGLPIGISFYTFQTLSYSIDVYRGRVKAQRNFLTFMLFVSLFHRLVAGPIVRYSDVEHELGTEKPTLEGMSAGITRFCIGLLKKVLVANYAGELCSRYLGGELSHLSVIDSWFGILMFAIQIYYDFSGYSDMALGLGLMFGNHYNENFMYPYTARSAVDFWRRWHISLSTFFRDYLYIPLGGNRRFMYRNLFIVWFLTGLWHGASWNFVLWGLYYGVIITAERVFLGKILEKLPAFIGHVYLLIVTLIGWTFFYFDDFGRLGEMFGSMFGANANPVWDIQLGFVLMNNIFWILLSVIFCAPLLPWIRAKLSDNATIRRETWLIYARTAACLLMLLISTALLVGESYNPFLYFQF